MSFPTITKLELGDTFRLAALKEGANEAQAKAFAAFMEPRFHFHIDSNSAVSIRLDDLTDADEVELERLWAEAAD